MKDTILIFTHHVLLCSHIECGIQSCVHLSKEGTTSKLFKAVREYTFIKQNNVM